MDGGLWKWTITFVREWSGNREGKEIERKSGAMESEVYRCLSLSRKCCQPRRHHKAGVILEKLPHSFFTNHLCHCHHSSSLICIFKLRLKLFPKLFNFALSYLLWPLRCTLTLYGVHNAFLLSPIYCHITPAGIAQIYVQSI